MNDRLEQAKKSPFFKKGDVIVYIALVALIVAMFLATGLSRNKSALEQIQILRDNQVIFTYDFLHDTVKASEGVSVEQTEEGYLVTITDGDARNVLIVKKEGYVKMLEANCSMHRDCVYMAPITDQGGFIECMPHRLIICAGELNFDPSVG